MGDTYDAIVIGAGANGLAAAATLARAGRRTLVLERCDVGGGSCASIEFAPAFHASPFGLDTGWVPPAVVRGLGLDLPASVLADPVVTLALEPGRFLSLATDSTRAVASIRAHSSSDGDAWIDFVARIRAMTGFLEALYQEPAPDIDASGSSELLRLGRLGLRLRRLGRAGMTDLLRTMPMSVGDLLDDTFESEPLKAAIAAAGVHGIRQGPRSGGTAFVLLHNLVGLAGALRAGAYWRDGPQALTSALEALARKYGATVRTNAAVARIEVRDDAVTGVVLSDGREIAARTVLSSADPASTLLGLVDPVWLDPEFIDAVNHIKYRGCTAFVLFALDRLPEMVGLAQSGVPAESALAGTVSLTSTMDGLERACDAAKNGRLPDRPHVEVMVPSLRWPDTAPSGRHVMIARAHFVPHSLRDGALWDEAMKEMLSSRVTDAIAAVAPGFTDRILHRMVLSPRDLELRYGFTEGAPSHGELTLDQILFMRPVAGHAHHAMPIEGLYLCGAGTHPGPGIPGGPGWLAAREALR